MEEVSVQIKRVVRNGSTVGLPTYMTEGSAGMDLCAVLVDDIILAPFERTLVPTGIALALPHGFEAQIRPRSGLALRQGLTLVNSPGTIDSDYRGEVQLILVNLGQSPLTIQPGQRVAQMIVQRVARVKWQEVDDLPESSRQDGGFGHTDKGGC
jgi:dUTP pyrophosphatase